MAIWPGADWHERETWDMFGIIFDGHPALTRILMPDDWPGHPSARTTPGHPRGVQGRHRPAAGPAEVVQLMSTDHTIFEDRDVSSEPSPGLDSDLPGDDTLRGTDYYAQGDTDGSPVFNVSGGDWDDLVDEATALHEERIVVNMGPQHPSTHGVLRLILELDAETVTEARAGIGYLHTGIEKNMEFRTWVQGVTFCTRMDYLTPCSRRRPTAWRSRSFLGITDQIPERASIIRVLMMELTRINSHLVCIGTGGMEMGATTVMTVGFRERERILRVFEQVTGLRMNMAYIRPGGVSQDLPHGALDHITTIVGELRRGIHELEMLLAENPLLKGRTRVSGTSTSPAVSR